MPTPPPVRRAVGLTRRTAIGTAAAIGAVVVAGCTSSNADRTPRPSPSPSPDNDPDVALAAAALADEQRLLDLVTATLDRHPGLGPDLSGARSVHRAHVRLLTEAVPDEPSASASPSPSATPSAPRIPGRPATALGALSRAEDRVSRSGQRNALAAQSGAFARVLASIAAAAAQQSVAMADAAGVRR